MGLYAAPSRDYPSWSEKRRHTRGSVLASANADFLSPAELPMFDFSLGGMGVNGVARIAVRNVGLVHFRSTADRSFGSATCKICWSDGQGRVGLKFVQLQAVSPDWQFWFAANAREVSETEPLPKRPASNGVTLPANSVQERPESRLSQQGRGPMEQQANPSVSVAPKANSQIPGVAALVWWCILIITIAVSAGALHWQWRTVQHHRAVALNRSQATSEESIATEPEVVGPLAVVTMSEGAAVLHSRGIPHGNETTIVRGTPIIREPPAVPVAALQPIVRRRVVVVLLISGKGSVDDVVVLEGDPRLVPDVVAATSHWRYTPFRIHGGPVAVDVPVKVTFLPTRAARQSSPQSQ